LFVVVAIPFHLKRFLLLLSLLSGFAWPNQISCFYCPLPLSPSSTKRVEETIGLVSLCAAPYPTIPMVIAVAVVVDLAEHDGS
jgi:hypothetical protein